eukprot:TRINITY_DN95862_c0_g1_i1.p1 TRINITY_DN95862_c0_g1~~TRINITY_DN95862_c0_g1_i1.p1  ORF type:complete len:180 (+),score=31.33 TRINITY_DN95862_c0_g1_i1:58-540(+)
MDKPPGVWHTQVEMRQKPATPASSSGIARFQAHAGNVWQEDPGWDDYGWEEEYDPYWQGQQWEVVKCRNGASCRFLAMGTCEYYHPESEIWESSTAAPTEVTAAAARGHRWNVWVNTSPKEEPQPSRERSRSRSAKGSGEPQRSVATPLRAGRKAAEQSK